MPISPEIHWPQRFDIENIRGGVRYSSSPTRALVRFEDVIHIDMTDFDPAVHVEGNPLVKKIISFDANRWIEFRYIKKTYTQDGNTYEYVWTDGYLYNGSTYTYILRSNQGIMLGQKIGYANVNYVKTHGIRYAFITDYLGAGVPVDDITEPYSLRLYQFLPSLCLIDYPSVTLSTPFDNILTGSLRVIENSDDPDEVISATGLYQGGVLGYNNYSLAQVMGDWTDMAAFAAAIGNPDAVKVNDGSTPSQDHDPSGPGGGDGEMDDTSDPIDFPELPTNGAMSSGAIKCFVVSAAHLIAVFNKLWNTSIFDIATFQKLLEAPLDSLISLQCVPIVPTAGANASIKFGNFDTEVSAPTVTTEYYTIDCGTLKVSEYWGNALDYSPYTKAQIFLPFVGIRDLQVDDIMGKTLSIKYNMDILTGNLTAQIKCGQSVLYKFNGIAKQTIPVTSRVNDALERAVKGAAITAAAGSGAGLAAAAISTAINVAMAKTHVSRAGDISGVAGILDDFTPYLILHRPQQSIAKDFRNFKGYPSNISAVLSTLSGYTEVEYIHLEGITGATDAELNEIERLLKSGVII